MAPVPDFNSDTGAFLCFVEKKISQIQMDLRDFWSRIRESKATKHIAIQLLFVFVAEFVAENILKSATDEE